MATLYFKVSSDWEQVVKLRQECEKLEAQLKKMDSRSAPAATKTLETQLASTKQQMMGLVTEAAKAGAEMENGFKKKIYDASQTVNGLSEKIISQRAVIKDIEFDVKRLGDAYRTALKNNPIGVSGKLAEYNAARKALDEEKAALFGLTQQQAEARLSVKKLRDEYSLYKKEAGDTVEINNGLSLSWGKMLGIIGGATALKSLVSQIVRVRGEFQSMQTAIETMVGKDVASGLMAQLKEMAKISPLTLTDIVDAEKMMLGFNIQAEDTVRYLQALSDISMGDSVKFKSLTLAFSQMSAAGKLMGQDLNQMINAGFNPLQIIAEKTGKSISTLKDEMSKGAISAEMVQQAFIDATSAGGKFYQMSENASKTINGQLSMMQDALDNAFNEMGQASEGVIMEGIQLTTTLIQNYETVGKVLVGLVATYGAYRTAVMLATIATSKHTIAEVALTNARVIARKAQLLLNAAMLTNPYVAVATVVTALVATMWTLSDSTSSAAKATREYNQAKEEAGKKEEEHKRRIDELLTSSRDESLATLTRQKSLEELRKEYPKIFEQYDLEKLKLEDILNIKRQINEEDSKRKVEKTKNDYSSLSETVSNQQRYLTLYDNPELRKNMSDEDMNIWRMFAGKKSYVEVREQMQKDAEKLKLLQRDVIADNIASYKANLKEFSEERLKVELQMAQSEASKRNGFNVGGIMVKGGDLAGIITSINNEIENRKPQTTYQQDLAAAKEDWEKAKKGYEVLIKDQDATSKQVIEARKKMEAAEKAYKDLSGVSLSKEEKNSEKRQSKDNKIFQRSELSYAKELEKEIDKSVELASEASLQMTEDLFAEQSAMNRYLQKYGTFQEKRLAITQEYQQKIAEAGGSDTWQGRLLQKQMEEALKELDFSQFKDSINFADVFGQLDTQSTEALTTLRDKLRDYINGAAKELGPEDLKELQDAFKDIDMELMVRQPFREMAGRAGELAAANRELERTKELLDAVRRGEKTYLTAEEALEAYNKAKERASRAGKNYARAEKTAREQVEKLSQSLQELGGTIGGQAGEIISLIGQVGSFASATVDGITQVAKTGADAISAVEKASVILGIISTAIQLLQRIGELGSNRAFGQYEEFAEKVNEINALTDAVNQYSMAVAEANAKERDWFSEDNLRSLRDFKALQEEVYKAYMDKATESQAIYQNESGGGWLTGAFNWIMGNMSILGWWDKWRDIWGQGDYAEGMTAAINNLRIETRKKSSGFLGTGIGGHSQETADLATWAREQGLGELFDEQGLINSELAQAIIDNYGDKLVGQTQETLEALMELREQYDQYIEELHEYVSSLYEPLVDNFVDSLWDWFDTGKDALDSFKEYASDTFRDIVSDMLRTIVLENVVGTFGDDIAALYEKYASGQINERDLMQMVADRTQSLIGDYQSQLPALQELMSQVGAMMQGAGIDLSGGTAQEQQSASSKGFETMTQDQASELNGRFTALYESSLRQETIQQGISNIAEETRSIIAQSYLELQQISENTGAIIKPIQQIQLDIAEVKQNTSRL